LGHDHDREISAYVDGELDAAELYRRTVARYRQP
jgi:anti-sigma factor RsiW